MLQDGSVSRLVIEERSPVLERIAAGRVRQLVDERLHEKAML
jgi:hypothetical protein